MSDCKALAVRVARFEILSTHGTSTVLLRPRKSRYLSVFFSRCWRRYRYDHEPLISRSTQRSIPIHPVGTSSKKPNQLSQNPDLRLFSIRLRILYTRTPVPSRKRTKQIPIVQPEDSSHPFTRSTVLDQSRPRSTSYLPVPKTQFKPVGYRKINT